MKLIKNIFFENTMGLFGNYFLKQFYVFYDKKHRKKCLTNKNYFGFSILKNRK